MPPTNCEDDTMPTKIKTITLKGPLDQHVLDTNTTRTVYRVERVTDSIEFAPDQFLSKVEVDALCHSNEWKVTVLSIRS
jgi:hypothetical protein